MKKIPSVPDVRRGKWSPPFDKEYWHVGEKLRRLGEHSIVTKVCRYKGRRVRFVLWMPASVWNRATNNAIFRPVILLTLAIALMIQFSVPVGWVVLVGLAGAYASWRFINRRGGKYMRVWENCTGFLLLDEKGRPIREVGIYPDFFKAYATWEEAYLRPAVLQKLSRRALESKFKVIRNWVLLGKSVKIDRHRKLDQETQKTHEALSASEERLTPKVEEKEILAAEINNLLYRTSEDMEIRRTDLVRKLTRLCRAEQDLALLIKKRAEVYDYWLALLDAQGLRVRFTRLGLLIAAVSGVASAILTRTLYPLLLLSLPVLKYGLDLVGGVRGLRRTATRHEVSASMIETAIERLDPTFSPSLIRFPS